jgi:phenylacetate-CoA ligase
LQTAQAMQRRGGQAIRDDQLLRLQKLVRYAFDHTEFYHARFVEADITPDSIVALSDLSRLPFVSKDDIRANKEQMVSGLLPKEKLIPRKTSGSTGVSLELYVDEASSQWKRAVTIAYDRWSGWDIGEQIGAIWGNPECYQNWRLYLRNMLLTRHIYLDTLKMDVLSMRRYHATLLRKKPVILFGHAHSLFLFARFMEQNGLSGIKPKGIISTCMVLHGFERETIERVFGCHVTNRYGCEEVSLIACECSQGNMHLNCDSLIVEFIRDGKPVLPGEPGAIVVTDLTNYGMPLIRYKIGDVGVPSAKTSCSCGCTYPIMDSLEGRVADYVVTPDGSYISGISLTENFAMHLPGVKQMQIVQEKIDQILFRIVKGEQYSTQTLQDLEGLARERFGEQMHWQTEFVDTIQSESSGKYRFCISQVPNPFC